MDIGSCRQEDGRWGVIIWDLHQQPATLLIKKVLIDHEEYRIG